MLHQASMEGRSVSCNQHRTPRCQASHLPRHSLQISRQLLRGDALICSSRSARDFNNHFNPPLPPQEVRKFGEIDSMSEPEDKQKQQAGNQFTSSSEQTRSESDPDARYWRGVPPDTMTEIRNRHAQNARVALRQKPQPAPGLLGIVFPRISPLVPHEEAYDVEFEHDYSRSWPSIAYSSSGQPSFRLGFLQPLADPELPDRFLHQGVETLSYGLDQRVYQAVVSAAYAATLAAVAVGLYTIHPMLAAATTISWLRSSLSIVKIAFLAILTLNDNLWIYGALFLFKRVDELFAKRLQPLRKFMIGNLALWLLYLALSPVQWTPLPFWPFS